MFNQITQARLKELLHYNPDTGLFAWIKFTGPNALKGAVAGSTSKKDGYLHIVIDGKSYLAQRLAHLYVKGYFPEYYMDHEFGVWDDNRWAEIRHVSRICNSRNQGISCNNSSGFVGVSFDKKSQKWRAYIKVNYKMINLGFHFDKVSAALARVAFEDNTLGFTCNKRQVNRVKLRSMGYSV